MREPNLPVSHKQPVPLHRVLPVVSASPRMVAQRLVLGRLRFIRDGVRLYVRHEDYLELCEHVWTEKVARLTGRGGESRSDEPSSPAEPDERRAGPKPICDGKVGWLHELGRRWRRK